MLGRLDQDGVVTAHRRKVAAAKAPVVVDAIQERNGAHRLACHPGLVDEILDHDADGRRAEPGHVRDEAADARRGGVVGCSAAAAAAVWPV